MDIKPKLVSFKTCPFVQKASIVLHCKKIDFDIEYIDLANPPPWFLTTSPRKKVPLLIIGNQILFESNPIIEYLDEQYSPALLPDTPIERAQHRAWLLFADSCLWDLLQLSIDKTLADLAATTTSLLSKLDRVEETLDNRHWFCSEHFSLIDATFATLFYRMETLACLHADLYDVGRHRKIHDWKSRLLAHPAVIISTVTNFNQLYINQLAKRKAYLASQLPKSHQSDNPASIY